MVSYLLCIPYLSHVPVCSFGVDRSRLVYMDFCLFATYTPIWTICSRSCILFQFHFHYLMSHK